MKEVQIDYTFGEFVETLIVLEKFADDELISLAEAGCTILDIVDL